MRLPEISYDLVMEPDMSFVEGTYRLVGRDWQVFIFSRRDIAEPRWRTSHWAGGTSGIVVDYPRSMILSQAMVERILSSALDVPGWSRVIGPDSMKLR